MEFGSEQEAFDFLIEKLISLPVLAYADYTKTFIVNIDVFFLMVWEPFCDNSLVAKFFVKYKINML